MVSFSWEFGGVLMCFRGNMISQFYEKVINIDKNHFLWIIIHMDGHEQLGFFSERPRRMGVIGDGVRYNE